MLEFEIQSSRYVGVGSFKETTSIYLWAVLWILIIRKDSLFHLWKNVYSTTYFQAVTTQVLPWLNVAYLQGSELVFST